MRDLDPRTVNLRTLPLQTGRRGFVLNALFVQNNFRHAIKDKGVSHDTMEDRRQYIYRAFHYLEHNDVKSFKLDPRSLGDRHVRFLFADMERRAKAGALGPSAQKRLAVHATNGEGLDEHDFTGHSGELFEEAMGFAI